MLKKEVVLFLGPDNIPLLSWLKGRGETIVQTADRITLELIERHNITFLISYNYQCIVTRDILDRLSGKAINLHISYLPWNRGTDPNFWSFIEDTPKGVSIHYLDEGIDTGDIIYQERVIFEKKHETLASTYQTLQITVQDLFKQHWNRIKSGECPRRRQSGKGSFHYSKDKIPLLYLLSDGWNTPIMSLQAHTAKVGSSTYICKQ